MKTYIYFLLLFVGIVVSTKTANAQVVQVITKDYRINKESCRHYIYELRDYLKSKGLYEEMEYKLDTVGPLKDLKKKLTFDGKFLADNYQFIVEIWGTQFTEDIFDDWGDFGIIEIGFASEGEAHEVLIKAQEACKKYVINIPVYSAPFRAKQVGKNVLIVYAINVNYYKFRDMLETWQPGL